MSQHLSVPARIGNRGYFTTVDTDTSISENLRAIVFVNPGEHIMRSEIGTPIDEMVWDPADAVFDSLVRTYCMNQIRRYETRIVLLDVIPTRTEQSDGSISVTIDIEYKKKNDRIVRNATMSAIFSRQA